MFIENYKDEICNGRGYDSHTNEETYRQLDAESCKGTKKQSHQPFNKNCSNNQQTVIYTSS
jgi:hypothetical protein